MTRIRWPHPGELLEHEFLTPLGISAYRLAKSIGVPQSRISKILAGERAITAETALLLSKFFGLSEGFWINAQADYDMRTAKEAIAKKLAKVEPYHAEAA